MRHASRGQAIGVCIPRGAVIIHEVAHLIVFTFDRQLYFMRFVEVPSTCEDCTTMWVTHVEFQMNVDKIVDKMGGKS